MNEEKKTYTIGFCTDINSAERSIALRSDGWERIQDYLVGTQAARDEVIKAVHELGSDPEFGAKNSLIYNWFEQDDVHSGYKEFEIQVKNAKVLVFDTTCWALHYDLEQALKFQEVISEAKHNKNALCILLFNSDLRTVSGDQYLRHLQATHPRIRARQYSAKSMTTLHTGLVQDIKEWIARNPEGSLPGVESIQGLDQIMFQFSELVSRCTDTIWYMGTVGLLSPTVKHNWVKQIEARNEKEQKKLTVLRVVRLQPLMNLLERHKTNGIAALAPLVDYCVWLVKYYGITKHERTMVPWMKVKLNQEVNTWKDGMAIVVVDVEAVLLIFGHEVPAQNHALLLRGAPVANQFIVHLNSLYAKSAYVHNEDFLEALKLHSEDLYTEWPTELRSAIGLLNKDGTDVDDRLKDHCGRFIKSRLSELKIPFDTEMAV